MIFPVNKYRQDVHSDAWQSELNRVCSFLIKHHINTKADAQELEYVYLQMQDLVNAGYIDFTLEETT